MKNNILIYKKNSNHRFLHWSMILGAILLFIIISNFFNLASAASGGSDTLGVVIGRVEKSVSAISRFMVLISYVAGLGFAMAGVLQFKAHKDNPTQVPLSKPIVYVCVAAFLLFLPQLMNTAGKTVFGGNTGIDTTKVNVNEITPERQ